MILGMSPLLFAHVVLSLVGIVAGIIVMFGMLSSNPLKGWTAWFLATTVLTSVTGFFLPAKMLMPSHIVGILSLVVLAIALYALYNRQLAGIWRPVYVVTAMIALWFNVFVLIAQSFLKIAPLKTLAPTGSEPPFLIAQVIVLIAFVIITIADVKKFRPV